MKHWQFYLVLFVSLTLCFDFACGTKSKPVAVIDSVDGAKRKLLANGWHIEEIGNGVKIYAKSTSFDKAKALRAFARDIRSDVDGVVFISYSDDQQYLVPDLYSQRFDEVYVIGEKTDVETCISVLAR